MTSKGIDNAEGPGIHTNRGGDEATTPSGKVTQLHAAAVNGDKGTLVRLINAFPAYRNAGDQFGRTPLMFCALADRVECGEVLLKSGVQVDQCDRGGRTALHWAAHKGNLRVMKLLISKGANIREKDSEGQTCLHLCTRHKSAKCIGLLIRQLSPGEIDDQDNNKRTALHWASSYGNFEHVKMLIKQDSNIGIPDSEGKTPLHWAASSRSGDAVQCVYIILKTTPSVINWQDYEGRTALHLAVADGNEEVINVLTSIDNCMVSALDNMFRTPLHWAAVLGHSKIVEILLERNPDYCSSDGNGATPLHYAAQNNYWETVETFLSHEGVTDEPDLDGRTAFIWAASKGADSVIDVFVRHNVDIHQVDNNGATALHAAALSGHPTTVKLLLEADALIDASDLTKHTPLLRACEMGQMDVVSCLIEAGSRVDVVDQHAHSPLHWAALGGHAYICELLIRNGVDPHVRDHSGRVPLQCAAYGGYVNCMSVLLEHEAEPNTQDREGMTALHWACSRGHLDAVKLLGEYYAFPNHMEFTEDRYTPLDYALMGEHHDVAQYLLELGALSITAIQDIAAQKIQSMFRGYRVRKAFMGRKQLLMKHEQLKKEAAKKRAITGSTDSTKKDKDSLGCTLDLPLITPDPDLDTQRSSQGQWESIPIETALTSDRSLSDITATLTDPFFDTKETSTVISELFARDLNITAEQNDKMINDDPKICDIVTNDVHTTKNNRSTSSDLISNVDPKTKMSDDSIKNDDLVLNNVPKTELITIEPNTSDLLTINSQKTSDIVTRTNDNQKISNSVGVDAKTVDLDSNDDPKTVDLDSNDDPKIVDLDSSNDPKTVDVDSNDDPKIVDLDSNYDPKTVDLRTNNDAKTFDLHPHDPNTELNNKITKVPYTDNTQSNLKNNQNTNKNREVFKESQETSANTENEITNGINKLKISAEHNLSLTEADNIESALKCNFPSTPQDKNTDITVAPDEPSQKRNSDSEFEESFPDNTLPYDKTMVLPKQLLLRQSHETAIIATQERRRKEAIRRKQRAACVIQRVWFRYRERRKGRSVHVTAKAAIKKKHQECSEERWGQEVAALTIQLAWRKFYRKRLLQRLGSICGKKQLQVWHPEVRATKQLCLVNHIYGEEIDVPFWHPGPNLRHRHQSHKPQASAAVMSYNFATTSYLPGLSRSTTRLSLDPLTPKGHHTTTRPSTSYTRHSHHSTKIAKIRSEYGQNILREARTLEGVEKKLARNQNHLKFTLRCKSNEITPPSLRLNCPVKTNRAFAAIKKAEKVLLRERVHLINNKIGSLVNKRDSVTKELNAELPVDVAKEVIDRCTQAHTRETTKAKCRQLKKFDRLVKIQEEEADLSGTELKKWVINLSKYKLSNDQNSVLKKGLNFAVTPKSVPVEDFVVATELACARLPYQEAEQTRAEVIGVLKNAKPPKSNLSKKERTALEELRKEKSILIVPADKGKATVVMDKTEYDTKVCDLLKDTKTYQTLKNDPTAAYKATLLSKLKQLKANKKITEQQYRYLYPTAENIPRLYCTPKIHKKDNPLRPIVDYTGSICYNLSKSLADILGPLVGNSCCHVENSKDLAEDLKEVVIDEEDILNSHDVVFHIFWGFFPHPFIWHVDG